MPVRAKRADVFIGADPGGGLAAILPAGVIYTVMPETELELWAWLDPLRGRGDIHATLERVWSWGGERASGAFTFGQGYGTVRMALVMCCGCEPDNPTPQRWQKDLGIEAKPRTKRPKVFKSKDEQKHFSKLGVQEKAAHKELLRATAQKLYPRLDVWDGTLKVQRAVCDAILLAHHCKLKVRK